MIGTTGDKTNEDVFPSIMKGIADALTKTVRNAGMMTTTTTNNNNNNNNGT